MSSARAASLKAGSATAPTIFMSAVCTAPRISTAIEYTPSCAADMLAPNHMRSPYIASTPTIDDNRIQRPNTISSVSAERSQRRWLLGPSRAVCPSTVQTTAETSPDNTSAQIEWVSKPSTSITTRPATCEARSTSTTRFCWKVRTATSILVDWKPQMAADRPVTASTIGRTGAA